MGHLSGEIEYIERGTAAAPQRILTAAQQAPIATLKLRVRDAAGRQAQVLFRGDTPGHLDVGDRVRVSGVMTGGLLRADTIFNETTNSWVTERGCFVATAVAGRDSAEVRTLRRLRDEVLLRSSTGRRVVSAYEAFSPPMARWLTKSHLLRVAARWFLVLPASIVGSLLVKRDT